MALDGEQRRGLSSALPDGRLYRHGAVTRVSDAPSLSHPRTGRNHSRDREQHHVVGAGAEPDRRDQPQEEIALGRLLADVVVE